MDGSSSAHERSSDIVKNHTFFSDRQTFLEWEAALKHRLDATRPDTTHACRLHKRRNTMNDGSGKDGKTAANLVLAAGQVRTRRLKHRASITKMLKPLYLSRQQDPQDGWVYAPPFDYQKLIFDEISPPEASMMPKLNKEDKIYSAEQVEIMWDALQLALSLTMDAMIKPPSGKDTTIAMERRCFADKDTTEHKIMDATKTFNDGHKKPANVANSDKSISADELKLLNPFA